MRDLSGAGCGAKKLVFSLPLWYNNPVPNAFRAPPVSGPDTSSVSHARASGKYALFWPEVSLGYLRPDHTSGEGRRMTKTTAAAAQCPMELGINILSGKWKLKILWQISKGAVRFHELQRRLGGITTKTLTQQLRELEVQRMIERTVYPDSPPRVEYALTELGGSIAPDLKALCDWGTYYRTARDPGGSFARRPDRSCKTPYLHSTLTGLPPRFQAETDCKTVPRMIDCR